MSYKYGSFGNFWHYNKLKILGIVLTIAFIALIVSQCSLGEIVDLGIVHISNVQNVDGNELLNNIQKDVKLKKAESEPVMEFNHIYIPDDFTMAKDIGALDKIQVEITSGKSNLFIVDEETLYSYKNDDVFYDLSEYAEKYGIDGDDCYYDANGKLMGISVGDNAYLEKSNLDTEGLYVGVRNHVESKKDEYENAFKALEYILKNR